MLDPLSVLGLAEPTSDEQVKKAYLTLIRQYSPERDPERFQQIRSAYEAASTEKRRLSFALFHRDEPDFACFVSQALPPRASQRPSSKLFAQVLAKNLHFPDSD
jgi:curved DNA-binding protein CbpA